MKIQLLTTGGALKAPLWKWWKWQFWSDFSPSLPRYMCLEVPQKKSWKKFEKCTSYATFKNYWFFTKNSSGYFWEESNFLTKRSLKWVKFDQFTSKMALMRDYTIVSEKMMLKLGKNTKYTPKKCPKLKKITTKFLQILVTGQLWEPF